MSESWRKRFVGGTLVAKILRNVVGKLSESCRKVSGKLAKAVPKKTASPTVLCYIAGDASASVPTVSGRDKASSWYLGHKMLPMASPFQTPRPDGCSKKDVSFIYKCNAVFFLSISISQACLAYGESPRAVRNVSERGRKVGESCPKKICWSCLAVPT